MLLFSILCKGQGLRKYFQKWLTEEPTTTFTHYAKVGETMILESEIVWKSIVGIDASQFYPFSLTKEMPTGPYTKRLYNEGTEKRHTKRNLRSYSKQQVTHFFQQTHTSFKCKPILHTRSKISDII